MSVRPTISRMTLSDTAFTVCRGSAHIERIVFGLHRIDLPDDTELHVGNVFIARQHQAFLGTLTCVIAAATSIRAVRKPISMELRFVTGNLTTLPIG